MKRRKGVIGKPLSERASAAAQKRLMIASGKRCGEVYADALASGDPAGIAKAKTFMLAEHAALVAAGVLPPADEADILDIFGLGVTH